MTGAVLCVSLAQRWHLSYPIVLVLGGLLIGFLPGLKPISLPPDLLLVMVLPPILMYAAFWTSWTEFKKNKWPILSLALVLVVITSLVVAYFYKWLFPDTPLALCIAIGAILSPPDAAAATTVLRRYSLSPRLISILEGESLINDASALVIYRISLFALITGYTSWSGVVTSFFSMSIGGVAVGLFAGYLIHSYARKYLEPVLGAVFSFIIPYIIYILAEKIGFSGVLAVVASGLVGARIIVTKANPVRRILGFTSWKIFIILVYCFVFILIGSELHQIIQHMSSEEILRNAFYSFCLFLLMLAVRFIWVYIYAYSYYKSSGDHEVFRRASIVSWCGMRGIVSLAAALALPAVPERGTILLIVFFTILLTLILPGLTLSYIIKRLHLSSQIPSFTLEDLREWVFQAGRTKLEELQRAGRINVEEKSFLENYFLSRNRLMRTSSLEKEHQLEQARLEVMQSQRHYLLHKWKTGSIDDQMLHYMEQELDQEETYLVRFDIQ